MSDQVMPARVADRIRAGHVMEDAPLAERPDVARWMCVNCSAAVLFDGTSVYGSATEKTCSEIEADWLELAAVLDVIRGAA